MFLSSFPLDDDQYGEFGLNWNSDKVTTQLPKATTNGSLKMVVIIIGAVTVGLVPLHLYLLYLSPLSETLQLLVMYLTAFKTAHVWKVNLHYQNERIIVTCR